MRTLVMVVTLVLLSSVVIAQTITERVDSVDGKDPSFSTYVQGLPGGLELWGHNLNTTAPMYRIGLMEKCSFGKIGGYFAEKNGQHWLNPRVCLVGKAFGGNGKLVVDGYLPLESETKGMVTLSDALVQYPVNEKVAAGWGMYGTFAEGKSPSAKLAGNLTYKLSETDGIFVRIDVLDLIGETPDGVRGEYCHKF